MSFSGYNCERHGYHAPQARRGARFSVTDPPMSRHQSQMFNRQMGSMAQPGSFAGCAYMGEPVGIVCQFNMPKYHASPDSYRGEWIANVDNGFPGPNIQTPGGLPQVLLGGGPGDMTNNPCLALCSCDGDKDCACKEIEGDSPGQSCGWVSVNQDCVAPVPGGMYPSLTACEQANELGFSG